MQTSEVEFVTGLWPKQRIIISYVLGHEQSVLTATQQKLSVDDFKWRKDMFGFVTMDVSLKLMLSIWQKYRLMCRAGLMEYIKKKNIEWLTLMLQKKKKKKRIRAYSILATNFWSSMQNRILILGGSASVKTNA